MATMTTTADPASAGSSTSSTPTVPTKDYDTLLFGSLSSILADELTEKIDAALCDGVSSLPLLSEKQAGQARLLELLRKTYFRNVDVMEAYMGRNIFSIQGFPPSKRNKIVQAFLDKQLPVSTAEEDKDAATSAPEAYDYPTDLPSNLKNEMESIQEELLQLRTTLKAARQHRNDVLQKLQLVTHTDQASKGAQQVLEKQFNGTKTHESVTAMVLGKQGLEDLQEQGHVLLKTLQEKKQTRVEDEEEDDLSHSKRPKLQTLQQQYQHHTQMTQTTRTGLERMKELLNNKNDSE